MRKRTYIKYMTKPAAVGTGISTSFISLRMLLYETCMTKPKQPQITMLIVNGIAGGCFFKYLDIPGGYMLGAVVGSMTVKLLALTNMQMPDLFYKGAQLAIGICVGSMPSLDTLPEFKGQSPSWF